MAVGTPPAWPHLHWDLPLFEASCSYPASVLPQVSRRVGYQHFRRVAEGEDRDEQEAQFSAGSYLYRRGIAPLYYIIFPITRVSVAGPPIPPEG